MHGEKSRKAETLKEVEKKFKYWRTHRKKRGPIPPGLLAEAHTLTKTYPLGILARALRINYNTLKKSKCDEQPAGECRESARGTKERPASFVEIPMPASKLPVWPKGSIELEAPGGMKARFFTSEDWIEGLLNRLFVSRDEMRHRQP